ncbi:hypothetical protein GCM10009836_09120 [Pseudonocardia ailaonensis]|uniref:Diacylglycerol O-acyltransferase n=1 Tax=Pseudonocardia ailaonensis TaxID=367279 RepID=A0ABN2MN99_9PSEU
MNHPQRLLLVTGSMGAGHHAAARAIEERAERVWPGVEVVWTETLDGMGAGPLFRSVYAGAVRYLPWLYELYFRLLWHVPFFRAGTRAVIGRWSGRGLSHALAEHRPDLVVATFPEGITGLAWLRERGLLPMPAVALVADPAPHPLWASAALDLHLVSTEEGARLLGRAAPGAVVRVAALPVVSRFALREPTPRRRPLALVSCGSLAFGDVVSICQGALDGGADVLVSTGRLPALRRRLEALGRPGLTVVDWIDDPAAATADADLVITNGGGATALEALACARPLLLADPIPGHGRANAEILAEAGLARICRGRAGVSTAVAELADPGARAAVVKELWRRREAGDLDADVAALADLRRPGPGSGAPAGRAVDAEERVRAQDALFVHASTPTVPQQVGARVVVEGAPGEGWTEHLDMLVRTRAPHLELLTRSLAPARPGRPLFWRRVPAPDPHRHVRRRTWTIGPGGDHPTWDDATTAFFADRLDPVRGWELQAAHEPETGDSAVLARVHHALGDGLAVTDQLIRLFTDENAGTPAGRAGSAAPPRRWDGVRHAALVARGIASLATAGTAGRSPLVGRSAPGPRRIAVTLDGAEVRKAARAHGVGTTVLVLALVAETLHHELCSGERVRAMVPMTTRTRAAVASAASGNRTAAVSVDLPTGPMTPAERVSLLDREITARSSAGQPEGAAAVLAGLGLLPGRLQQPLVRLVYGRRFFHMIASVMPGARRPLHFRGGLIREVQPVLPLGEGVGLAVGAMHWGRYTCLGITVDTAIVPVIEGIPAGLRRSLGSMQPGE